MPEGTAPLRILTGTGGIPPNTRTEQKACSALTVHAVTGVPEPTSAPILDLG